MGDVIGAAITLIAGIAGGVAMAFGPPLLLAFAIYWAGDKLDLPPWVMVLLGIGGLVLIAWVNVG